MWPNSRWDDKSCIRSSSKNKTKQTSLHTHKKGISMCCALMMPQLLAKRVWTTRRTYMTSLGTMGCRAEYTLFNFYAKRCTSMIQIPKLKYICNVSWLDKKLFPWLDTSLCHKSHIFESRLLLTTIKLSTMNHYFPKLHFTDNVWNRVTVISISITTSCLIHRVQPSSNHQPPILCPEIWLKCRSNPNQILPWLQNPDQPPLYSHQGFQIHVKHSDPISETLTNSFINSATTEIL